MMREGNKETTLHNVHFFPPQACDDLSLVNIILTNHYLIVLTTMGLFVSEDLCCPTGKILK